MKELSTEEKAKRYDEALERARKLQENSNGMILKKWLWNIFSELKESEDEKIRKWIVRTLKSLNNSLIQIDGAYEMMLPAIAWLEKQGEKSVDKLQLSEELYEHIRNTCAYIDDALSSETLADTNDYLSMAERSAQSAFDMIEKQREKNTAGKVEPKFKIKYAGSEYNVFETKDIAGVTFYGIEDEPNHIDYVKAENCDIISVYTIKENGSPYPTKPAVFSEQKHADKAESKFHEGDWIIYNNDICQIVKREEGCNKLVTVFGIEKELVNERNLSTARIWTIQDAKDGDVLSDETTIFIFKDLLSDGSVMSYCDYDANSGESDAFCPLPMNLTCSKITPATKEQRDLLFSKMKEVGYEWDAEKKELKKIEQTIEIPFGAKDSELQEITYYIPKGFYAEIDDDKVVIKKGEKPTTWSEEDLRIINNIILVLSNQECWDAAYGRKENLYQKEIYWLKSLKDRVQPQPKQEWSEEDENRINRLIAYFEDKESFTAEDDVVYANWLKSLKSKSKTSQWKPSYEQMKFLWKYAEQNNCDGSILTSLYNDLKKLKD